MLRGKGKRSLSKSSASRPGSHGGASSNTSYDVREERPTSLSTGRGRSFVPQTRESLSSGHADSTLPHTSSSSAPLQKHDNSSHDNDDIPREVTNVEGRGAALPFPPNRESRQELYIRNGKIQPYGRGQWVRCASHMIRSHFKGPWVSWLKVPEAYKQLMWKGFLQYYKFATLEEENAAYDIWQGSCSNSLKNLLFDAREHAIIQSKQAEPHNAWKDFPPNWIEQKDWEELVDFWNSGDWIKQHEAGKQNRAKGAIDGSYCLHTGGSICFDEWGQREVEKNPNVTPIDVFERTHKRNKGDGDWVNPKAKRVSERYNELRAHKIQESDESGESSINQSDKYFDPELFYNAIGGVKKGTTFGLPISSFEGVIPPKRCGSASSSIGCTPLLSQAQLDARLSEQQERYEAKISELMASQQQMREDMERQMREEMERKMQEKIEQQLQHKEIELEQKFQRQQATMMEQMRLML